MEEAMLALKAFKHPVDFFVGDEEYFRTPEGDIVSRSETLPIPYKEQPLSMAALKQSAESVHNFNGTPLDIWSQEALATGCDCADGSDYIGKRLEVESIYIHRIEIDGEDGEMVECYRTVLLTINEPLPIGFVSDGVAKGAFNLLQTLGQNRFDPAVSVRISSKKTSKGHRFYSLGPWVDN